MIRKYHNHTLETNPWHRKEESRKIARLNNMFGHYYCIKSCCGLNASEYIYCALYRCIKYLEMHMHGGAIGK